MLLHLTSYAQFTRSSIKTSMRARLFLCKVGFALFRGGDDEVVNKCSSYMNRVLKVVSSRAIIFPEVFIRGKLF